MGWICEMCTLINEEVNMCAACDTERRTNQNEASEGWRCERCTLFNKQDRATCEACQTRRPDDPTEHIEEQKFLSGHKTEEIRLVVVGRTGSGKSATCNTIVGKEVFRTECSSHSITSRCQHHTTTVQGVKLTVVDTPGLFDTGMTKERTTEEILKCFGHVAPGPHAFILTIGVGRYTKEVCDTVAHFQTTFGPDMIKHLVVVFTRTGELKGKSVGQYITESPPDLIELMNKCKYRYVAFDNIASPEVREQQVRELIHVIESMNDNCGYYYTNLDFQHAEMAMREREFECYAEFQIDRSPTPLEDLRTTKDCEQRLLDLQKLETELQGNIEVLHSEGFEIENKYKAATDAIEERLVAIQLKMSPATVLTYRSRWKKEADDMLARKGALWDKIESLQIQIRDAKNKMEDIKVHRDTLEDYDTDLPNPAFLQDIREAIRCEIDQNSNTIMVKLRCRLRRFGKNVKSKFQRCIRCIKKKLT